MQSYDFDRVVDRRDSDSAKWSYFGDDVLPMWVADMDFASPPAVIEALQARVSHGVFGYGMESKRLRELLVSRLERLYGWAVAPEEIVFLPGLVSGLNVVSRAIGDRGDGVLVNTPVYGPFLTAPTNQFRELHVAPLCEEQRGGHLYYSVDFDGFRAAIRPNTRLFMLCNPHNPIGRAYTRGELEQMASLCAEHDLVICADEIHCDLMMNGARHIPMASLSPEISQRTITLMAPSKTFNMPGLGASFAIVQNPELRKRVEQAMAGIVPHVNVLGIAAAEAAYAHGAEWLEALLAYLTANRDAAVQFLSERLPSLRCTLPEATYLLWLDCREAGIEGKPADFFQQHAQVAVNDGAWFGQGGAGFVRLNYGCPRSTLMEGLERIERALAAK
ncbi:MAG: putative C-S lyase [Caldilineaceae bacterium]|nr:putative C-S lyase [Caldilineaceae bacterium]